MKLVSARSLTVVDLRDGALPPYAVLSHTRGIADRQVPPPTPAEEPSALCNAKFAQACDRALQNGVEYIWIDELCIDRSSMVDLDDAINGSRRRLCNSTLCLAYLHDLPADTLDDDSFWSRCRYWKRVWTLQELILPPCVKFYDYKWNYRGNRDSPTLASLLSSITTIPESVLVGRTKPSDISLGVRISWSIGRNAEREEDVAYALIAITNVTLPIRYGEGAKQAFLRLQEEILRDTRDGSLLAWQSAKVGEVRGLLAQSPSEFSHFTPTANSKELQRPWMFNGKVCFSSKGIEIESRACKKAGCLLLAIGQRHQDLDTGNSIAICLREWNGVYLRVAPASYVPLSTLHSSYKIDIARDLDNRDSQSLRIIFTSMPYRLDVAKCDGNDQYWRQGPQPCVVLQQEESTQESEDLDTRMMLETDRLMVPFTPQTQESRTPSNTSDGSHLNVALTGSWMGSEEQQRQQRHQPTNDDTLSDPDLEDDQSSAGSDLGSLTSGSACTSSRASVIDLNSDEDGYYEGYQHRNGGLYQGENATSANDFAAETYSTTTLTPDKDDQNSLKNLIMESSIRDQVLKTSYERVCHWISTAHYIAPPEDRLPPSSRINTSAWFARPESLALLVSGSVAPDFGITPRQQQLVTVFQPHGYFHLACPFFAADPRLHLSCVVGGQDLQSIGAVLRHVRTHHAWSPYCPRCLCDFDRDEDRDVHILERACLPAGRLPSHGDAARKGVRESEARRLKKVDRRHRDESEVQRWWRIYWSLFPDLEEQAASSPSGGGGGGCGDGDIDGCGPYLRTGNGFAVSLLHDFWTLRREECVVAGLEACGHTVEELNDHEALSALYQVILKELISKLYHEYHLEKRVD